MTSDDSGPTCEALKAAWKLNLAPAATASGKVGRPLMMKFGFPVNEIPLIVMAIFAVQDTVFGAVGVAKLAVPNS
jgi:hypothetical protein